MSSIISSFGLPLEPSDGAPPVPVVAPVVPVPFGSEASVEEKQALAGHANKNKRAHRAAARVDWVFTRHLTLEAAAWASRRF
jgi:hypothetical protein